MGRGRTPRVRPERDRVDLEGVGSNGAKGVPLETLELPPDMCPDINRVGDNGASPERARFPDGVHVRPARELP